MTPKEKFKEMALSAQDAIETFNDFADDRAIVWAWEQIKGTSAEVNCLASCLDMLEKIHKASEINDYGNIVIPEQSYSGDFYEDILNQIGYTKRVIGSNLEGK